MKTLKYCPELNTFTGSITASLVLCQLEYWFSKKDLKPFYKFLSPCEDEHYHQGDSWTEELGFTKAEFRTAFRRIGKVYKSKSEFLKSKDPFGDKLYLSYYDRIKKLTYYMRHNQKVDKLLENQHCVSPYSVDYPSSKIPTQKSSSIDPPTTITASPTVTVATISTPASPTTHPPTPIATTSAVYTTTPVTSTSAVHTDSPFTTSIPATTLRYDRILTLFHQHCPSLKPIMTLTSKCKWQLDKLCLSIKNKGLDLITSLTKAFTLVESSDFLCGKGGSTFKAAFGWIIRLDKFFAILDGVYKPFPEVQTKLITKPVTKPPSTFMRMYTHNFDLEALQAREDAYVEALYGQP